MYKMQQLIGRARELAGGVEFPSSRVISLCERADCNDGAEIKRDGCV